MKSTVKAFKSYIKIGVSLVLIIFVFTKIDLKDIWQTLRSTEISFLLLAVASFIFSQIISSYRLNYILHQESMLLSQRSNLKLYFLGMFYNFFIPGGIGGDAYKVYLLNKTFHWPRKKVLKAVFVDRYMGLIAIGFILLALLTKLPWEFFKTSLFQGILLLAAVVGIVVLYKLTKYLFHLSLKAYYLALLFSLIVQLFQLLSVVFIMKSMSVETLLFPVYLFVFLISSVLSLLSFAGIGIREYIFLQASVYLQLEKNIAISIGAIFSIITAAISLIGIYNHFKNPKLVLLHEQP
ncbi:lysylphosphatidylglycerol synthase transmembrane domain-containing protein [Galbibacter mesophilus]|uniref:lysylphosphatidylglycerol synthase transmembrane domain-containing protein n=1 Tax=Galbibacter mesophilus TaxID=379069 RepID=UPI00191FCD07|nr:lysylphosphatidylglycerol synthase transmembrane domain-containing protein [Galbibacter mesophilus]MCM5664166.1 flippase-like domain-containing protein [Galbibacter mesophilus]